MTYLEISNMIYQFGLPFAYDHFNESTTNPDGTAIAPPYIIYYWQNDSFYADNITYVGSAVLFVELYTENKDIAQESVIEGVLKGKGLSYEKYSTYLHNEKLWQITYRTEVFLNE